MNILAVGAHPDDIEFGCAPILLRETAAGNRVHLLVLSRGEAGTAGTPEERTREAEDAAAKLDAALTWLDFGGDCHLQANPKSCLAVAAEIRRLQPQIVLAPSLRENQHPDHTVAGQLVRDACRFARYGGLTELKPAPPHRVAALYFYNITQHGTAEPDIVIDISEQVEAWKGVMNCHSSQIASKSYLELQLAAARLLGLGIGVEYAAGLYANDPIRIDRLSSLTLTSRNF